MAYKKSLDSEHKTSIIKSIRPSGEKSKSQQGHYLEKIDDIDFNSKSAVAKTLSEFEVKYKSSEIEHCRIITVKGEFYEVHGDKTAVDTTLLGDKMQGSINSHNHVTG